MTDLRKREAIAARALEFTILTAARTAEVTGAQWNGNEISLENKTWNVPEGRMKAGKAHKVPLSDRAVEILQALLLLREQGNDHVFIGPRGGGLSNAAMAAVIDRMNEARAKAGLPKWTDPQLDDREVVPHGFRSTFMDYCHEQTSFPKVVIDMALAHAVDDKVEAAYRRSDLFAKRVQLMKAWALYCVSSPRKASADVVAIRGIAP
jgi:integrase